jgi:hypothetical protein
MRTPRRRSALDGTHCEVASQSGGMPMADRKLDELAADVDDAKDTVEELQQDPTAKTEEQLDDLHNILEDASDAVDDLANKK